MEHLLEFNEFKDSLNEKRISPRLIVQVEEMLNGFNNGDYDSWEDLVNKVVNFLRVNVVVGTEHDAIYKIIDANLKDHHSIDIDKVIKGLKSYYTKWGK